MNRLGISDFLKNKGNAIKREFWLIIIGGIIFTASFLWKDFLSDVEESFFPKSRGLVCRGLYVLIVSIILVSIAVAIKSNIRATNTKLGSDIDWDDWPIGRKFDDQNNNDHADPD